MARCSSAPRSTWSRAAKTRARLNERGFQQAGLYNPQGVGGTHVMYVLQHADRPDLYNNLPNDPTISPWVSLWKGIAKPLMALALGVAALGAFFHFVTRGPKEVDESADSGGRTVTRHDREV